MCILNDIACFDWIDYGDCKLMWHSTATILMGNRQKDEIQNGVKR